MRHSICPGMRRGCFHLPAGKQRIVHDDRFTTTIELNEPCALEVGLQFGIGRLKQWRGLATRYEKRAVNYRAMVVIASIVLWLRS
jgi:transposase